MTLKKRLMMVALVVVFAGCTAPIKNVDHEAITTAPNKTLRAEQVRSAIMRAGAALGWVIKDNGPNALVGTLNLRKHTAVVDIPYSATSYSITYRSSINLNEKDGKIHKNYNGWIQNLSNGIDVQLKLANS